MPEPCVAVWAMARMNTIRTVVRLHFKDGLTGRDGFSSGARHPLFPKLQRRGGHQMAVNVRIPTPLRKFTNDQSDVEIEGSSVGEVIEISRPLTAASKRSWLTRREVSDDS